MLLNKIILALVHYWWLTTIGIISALLLSRPFIVSGIRRNRISSLESKLKSLNQSKIEAEKRYYKEGSLPRSSYQEITAKINEDIVRTKSQLSQLKQAKKKKKK